MYSESRPIVEYFPELAANQVLYSRLPGCREQGPSLSSDDLVALVERFAEEGEFLNDAAARSLKVHLIAVSRYEEKELAGKVVQQLNGFKLLLDHQKENELISKKVYDILCANTEFVIKNWQ
jgi:prolyl-tRNA synthetase